MMHKKRPEHKTDFTWDWDSSPFTEGDASKEKHLDNYFITPTGFEEMLSYYSCVLYAKQGGGKTACRRQVESFCEDSSKSSHPVFSVTYDDFYPIIIKAGKLESVTANMHIDAILKNATAQLFNYLIANPEKAELLQDGGYFKQFIKQYSPNCLAKDTLNFILQKSGITKDRLSAILGKWNIHSKVNLTIESNLYQRLYNTLSKCGPFKSHSELNSVFVDSRIHFCKDKLPEAKNLRTRVTSTIDFLNSRYNSNGENALALFLQVLSEHFPPNDACKEDLAQLAEEAKSRSNISPKISSQREGLNRLLAGITEDYHPLIRFVANLLKPSEIDLEKLSTRELLEKFFDIIHSIEFEAMFILVDNVDGLSKTNRKPQFCANLLGELVGTTSLMSIDQVYFKFFLPLDTKPYMDKFQAFETQRVRSIIVEWGEDELHKVLQERLKAATNGRVDTVAAISVPEIQGKVDAELVQKAQVPRDLVNSGRKLFRKYNRKGVVETLLTEEDFHSVLTKTGWPRKLIHSLPQLVQTIGLFLLILFGISTSIIWLTFRLPSITTPISKLHSDSIEIFATHSRYLPVNGEGKLEITIRNITTQPITNTQASTIFSSTQCLVQYRQSEGNRAEFGTLDVDDEQTHEIDFSPVKVAERVCSFDIAVWTEPDGREVISGGDIKILPINHALVKLLYQPLLAIIGGISAAFTEHISDILKGWLY
jgi:hypothetical protein